jgi:hypothetical protein
MYFSVLTYTIKTYSKLLTFSTKQKQIPKHSLSHTEEKKKTGSIQIKYYILLRCWIIP